MLTGVMLKILDWFQHQADRQIAGMTGKYEADETWEYPPAVTTLEAAELYPIQEYIRRWKVTIAEQLACRPNYEICTKAERKTGTIQIMRWWYRDVAQEYEE